MLIRRSDRGLLANWWFTVDKLLLSAVLLLAIVGVFGWAVFHGQFEDVQREGERILTND